MKSVDRSGRAPWARPRGRCGADRQDRSGRCRESRMTPFGLPGWLRIVLVAGAVFLVAGAAFFAYRWYTRPTTLSIAVGSLDGEAGRIVTAIAGRFAEKNAPVRLHMVDTASALESANAFSSGK